MTLPSYYLSAPSLCIRVTYPAGLLRLLDSPTSDLGGRMPSHTQEYIKACATLVSASYYAEIHITVAYIFRLNLQLPSALSNSHRG